MELGDFLSRLDGVRQQPSGTSARCPAHDDHVASLSVSAGREGGNIVLFCHAGCPPESVVAAMGLTMADLAGLPHKVEEYHYTDMNGAVLYTKERWANPKTFRYQRPLPPPAERVLYNQVCIPWARANGRAVLWVEGERDVNNCSARGIPSVTGCEGAGPGKLLPQYFEALRDVDVDVVCDNDMPGREFGREKVRGLTGVARSVRLLVPRVGKDVTDLFEAGYDLSALEPLPEYEDVPAYVASRVRTRKVEWAWDRYFPLGKLSLLEGDPGDGKSVLTADLAARWSTGSRMPDRTNGFGPVPVLMVSAEDDPDDTLVPRLEAAGADLDRVVLMPHGVTPEVPFTFRDGLPAVYQLVVRHGIRVIFFDPLMAFLSAETDSHNDASVRRALQPLKILASNTGACVVVVRHLNKGSGAKAIYRGGGSIAFTGAARATFLVSPSPDDDNVRVLANVKANLTRRPPSLTYTVEESAQGVPYIRWGGPVEMTAQTALDGNGRRGSGETGEDLRSRRKVRTLAGEFLLDIVREKPLTWAEVMELAKAEGFSKNTLERARAEVGLTKLTGGEGQRTTTWASPQTPPSPPLPHFPTSGSPTSGTQTSGEMVKWAPRPETVSDVEEIIRRDDALLAAPLECDVCGTDNVVTRWHEPFWVIRCKAHDPRRYAGTDNDT
jgi:putative DNA primase/helicase